MSLALTQGATRINNSHQHARGKRDSRRGDESSNDVQKTLRVAHPSGGREQLERFIERRLQRRKSNEYEQINIRG
ncbi:hypothetical protein F2Q69_00012883 [Brassica cretica]|uniref:Uncharacterized protein n=1 Tax=Brassica cretica TaxID=69181 RepID=A0A8S9RA34_BRACR|nr:hypothetical protein F2Q69_00012883 [Brassica cretica]